MSEYIVDGAVTNHTVRVEDEREVYWRMTHLPVREEIVRCHDCYYCTDSFAWPGTFECDFINRGVEPDGYCAWGERRDA